MFTRSKNNVLAIFGPTASGKTELLKRLFVDTGLNDRVEIVSADSIQVFRGLTIGSAKPDPDFLDELPHRLIDIMDPERDFSIGDFIRLADEACTACIEGGKLPVISGGTAYYIKGFIMGIPETPMVSPEIRIQVQHELKQHGIDVLREELKLHDPVSFSRIHYNDTYRLTRALEVFRATGKPLSSFTVPVNPRPQWNVHAFALNRPRDELLKRIEHRVDAMFHDGLIEEIKTLLAKGYSVTTPGLKGIGYAEFMEAVQQHGIECLNNTTILAQIKNEIILHTRQYAKRQMTFMRSLPDVVWIDPNDIVSIKKAINAALAPDILFEYTEAHDA